MDIKYKGKNYLKCEVFDLSLESMNIFNILQQIYLLESLSFMMRKNMFKKSKKNLYLFEENQKENHQQ